MTQVQASSEPISSSYLDDQPSDQDYLGFDSYVDALFDSIINENTKTPLTLGIFGRWGTGKSTIMRMLEKKLRDQNLITLGFNAWQYNKEDELWAAFLQSIIININGQLHFFPKLFYKLRLLWRRINWAAVPGAIINYLIRAVITIIPLLLVNEAGDLQPTAQTLVQTGGTIATLGLSIWLVIRPLMEAVQENVTIDFNAFKQQSDYEKHIGFLDKFRDHFNDIVKCLPGNKNKKLAVFIDDLDRCSTERILEVLDAIKLFVDIAGCIYVIGIDAKIVQAAVAEKYKGDPIARQEYLGKIVQIPFQLPNLTYNQIKEFLHKLPLDLPDERCREVFVAGLQKNPREVKRAINLFSLLWYLASKRPELNIKSIRLVKIVVIQHGHSELYTLLQQQPKRLIDLEKYFRQAQERARRKASRSAQRPRVEYELDKIDLVELREFIVSAFNLEEIQSLCFYLDIDYEDLSGETRQTKVLELIDYMQRHGRIIDLIDQVREERPIPWQTRFGTKEKNSSIGTESADETEKVAKDVPEQLLPLEKFLDNDQLRRMLLLHPINEIDGELVDEEECSFATLDSLDIETYFTLTSRTEAPIIDENEPERTFTKS